MTTVIILLAKGIDGIVFALKTGCKESKFLFFFFSRTKLNTEVLLIFLCVNFEKDTPFRDGLLKTKYVFLKKAREIIN